VSYFNFRVQAAVPRRCFEPSQWLQVCIELPAQIEVCFTEI
jgi:hypothetical protein